MLIFVGFPKFIQQHENRIDLAIVEGKGFQLGTQQSGMVEGQRKLTRPIGNGWKEWKQAIGKDKEYFSQKRW